MLLVDSDFNPKVDIPREIEELKASANDLSYIECVIHICEKFALEPESMKSILPKAIKEKILFEATQLNMMKTKPKVTLDKFF